MQTIPTLIFDTIQRVSLKFVGKVGQPHSNGMAFKEATSKHDQIDMFHRNYISFYFQDYFILFGHLTTNSFIFIVHASNDHVTLIQIESIYVYMYNFMKAYGVIFQYILYITDYAALVG